MPKDKRQVPSAVVAKYLLKLARKERPPQDLTPLKLMKLTYLVHGWTYAGLEKRLISDPVEAWTYGPVFPDLYYMLKKYGKGSVKRISMSDIQKVMVDKNDKITLNKREKALAKIVYDAYKDISVFKLVAMTHEDDSPWDKTRNRISRYWNREIAQNLIREHFESQLAE